MAVTAKPPVTDDPQNLKIQAHMRFWGPGFMPQGCILAGSGRSGQWMVCQTQQSLNCT